MYERMDALTNKVETFGLLAIIKALEIMDPLEKQLMGVRKLSRMDLVLVHYSDGDDELAVVLVVRPWKYAME